MPSPRRSAQRAAAIFPLINEIRRYAWGSPSAMAEFLGREAPTGEPEAELWIGAYPACPSRLSDGRTLPQLITAAPEAMLGAEGVAQFGPRLPFLMKVLTIGAPLSLQAHPNAAQAQAGFAAEERAGVRLDDPNRNYRDSRHKPELFCALTSVEAFCGFRDVSETVGLLDGLAVAELEGLRAALSGAGLEKSIRWVLDLAEAEVEEAVSALGKATCRVRTGPYKLALKWISRLAEEYANDRGVVLALLCAFFTLAPGEAIFVPAGCLHAYVAGVGIEVMAESDNVLRGGLTGKHVDVVELQRILDFSAHPALVRASRPGDGRQTFAVPVEEFALSRIEVSMPIHLETAGPQLLLTVQGAARLSTVDGTIRDLPRGQTAFVAAGAGLLRLDGPAVVFAATTGLPIREDPGATRSGVD